MNAKKLFAYQTVGETQPHYITAHSRQEAKQQLLKQGILPFQLRQRATLRAGKWKRTDLALITRQLAMMLQAGLPLLASLQLIADQHPNVLWKYLLLDINRLLLSGFSLSNALHQHGIAFPPLYIEMIHTAEITGQLDTVLMDLAKEQEKQSALIKKVRHALRYPLFLLSFSLLLITVMLLFILPQFAQIYSAFDTPLPRFTQLLISLPASLQTYGILLLSALSLILVCYLTWLHPHPFWQYYEQKYVLCLPILGRIVHQHHLTILFKTLSLTQRAGVPLLVGLNAAEKSMPYLIYKEALKSVTNLVEQGVPLSKSIQHTLIFSPLGYQLIHVGETSGTLDIMLTRLATLQQKQVEELTHTLSQAIEPLLMLVLGVIIGSIVVALYLPILQLGNIIG